MINLPDTGDRLVGHPRVWVTYRTLGYRCPCGSQDLNGTDKTLWCHCGRYWYKDSIRATVQLRRWGEHRDR